MILLALICILLPGNILLWTKRNADKPVENVELKHKYTKEESKMHLEATNSNFVANEGTKNIYKLDLNYFLNMRRNISYDEIKEKIGRGKDPIAGSNMGGWSYYLNDKDSIGITTVGRFPISERSVSAIYLVENYEMVSRAEFFFENLPEGVHDKKDSIDKLIVAGEEATYHYEERDLEIADFMRIPKGASYEYMLKIFGEPNGKIKRTGQLYYELDGKYVVMPKDFKKGSGVGLEYMDVCTAVLYRNRITLKK